MQNPSRKQPKSGRAKRSKRARNTDVILGLVAGLVGVCCLFGMGGAAFIYLNLNGGLPSLGGFGSPAVVTETAVPTQTLVMLPTATLIPTATPESLLLFDDFSTSKSGLPVQKDDDKLLAYTEIGYRISVYTPKLLIWAPLEQEFGDASIEVDVSRVAGPMVGDVGVLCRLQDDNFYAFLISGDGQYAVLKYVNGIESFIGMEDRMTSENIRRGNVKNHIAVVCAGSTLRLSVNDQLLIETTDTSLRGGGVALAVGTRENPGVDALFNNLKVYVAGR